MNKKIIFSSGGTGGHTIPAINLMKHFDEKNFEVILVTDKRGVKFLKGQPNFKSYIVESDTPQKKFLLKKVLSYFKILHSIIKAAYILNKEKPKLIIGFGGYASFPISFISRFFNIPLIIYENNLILGKVNKYLLPSAKKILLTNKVPLNFPKKYEKKICQVGTILDKDIINYAYKEKTKKDFFSILVLGGSQGAKIFGKVIHPVMKMIQDKGYKIKINQQCTEDQEDLLSTFYKENKIENNIFKFRKNILNLFSSSDLAISRCGAASTAELVETYTPFIAIPYPYAGDNHQYLNGKYYEKEGCCWLLEENNLNSKNLFNLMIKIIQNNKLLENMRKKMKNSENKNVYINIENIVEEFFKNEN